MFEKIFAAVIVVGCLVLLLRLVLGADRRYRFDAALRRGTLRTRAAFRTLFGWNAQRRTARREADAAIRRARNGAAGEWEGNVYRPKSFRKGEDSGRDDGRTLH